MDESVLRCLNEEEVFKEVSEWARESKRRRCLRLTSCGRDTLYVWRCGQECVEALSLRPQQHSYVPCTDVPQQSVSYVPTPRLCFDVEELLVNGTCSVVALCGGGGVAVMKLPEPWPSREGRRVEVRAAGLAERAFLVHHETLRRARWHPSSPTDSHLLLLTSDEKLRLYSALDETLLWECSLAGHTVPRRSLPTKLTLGETPVDFDLGPCELHEGTDPVHTVLVVWGNGDVYSLRMELREDGAGRLHGPLRVAPAAEDNYGCDASSVAVLDTRPPTVVIATGSGLLYHCLLLGDECGGEGGVLHVVERVQLELGLPLGECDTSDVVSCPVSLHRDPHLLSRYFCLHSAGIHSVTLPLVSKLEEFSRTGRTSCLTRVESGTDYLLCTAVTTGSDTMACSPTLGVAFLDFTKVMVLLANGKLVTLHLPSYHYDPAPLGRAEEDPAPVDTHHNFQLLIENLLKDGGVSSCPLIKLPTTATRPQDWLEIVLKATRSYRAVLKTHSEVALKIQQKTHQLESSVSRQTEELGKLNGDKAGLRSTAEQIAEKYEEINERQTDIMRRTERLLLNIECGRDGVNQKNMTGILERAKAKIAVLQRDINAVQSFYTGLETDSKQPDEKEIHFGSKTHMLYKNLKHLSGEISDLTGRVKTAQQTVAAASYLHDST